MKKIIIIDEKKEGFWPKLKDITTKILITIISLTVIIGVFYLAVLTSLFLIGLFLAISIILFIIAKINKNKTNPPSS